ncbi:MAG: radical SAM protein [Chitinivibrionales bacterium]
MLKVSELFTSIQGESTHVGRPCFFIRLAGCNLRCVYCDTVYACDQEGYDYSVDRLINFAGEQKIPLVEITGGEPLLQSETPELCRRLLENNFTVMIETNGTLDIGAVPANCIRIVDVKCPDSGEKDSFLLTNLDKLNASDELKFVLSSREDFDWALHFVAHHKLQDICTILFSPNLQRLVPSHLVSWILDCRAPVRLGLQLHKYIWEPDTKGV